ncbi:MAG: alkaline phosphatase [Candidatus Scalindua sp.]|nr:alkaline phosphatase [Candidatus Scalindua sp.]
MSNKKPINKITRLERMIIQPPLYLILFSVFFLLIPRTDNSFGECSSGAKYIILMIADGNGIKQIEATNQYTGTTPSYQTDPTWLKYFMSTFPEGGSYDTTKAWTNFNYALQNPVTDSAAAAITLYSGSKTQNSRISVSADGVNRLFSIGDKAKTMNLAIGAISTVPLSHATPGAWTSHNDSRFNGYAIGR